MNHRHGTNTLAGSVSEVYIMRNKNKCMANVRRDTLRACVRANVWTRKHTRGISASILKEPLLLDVRVLEINLVPRVRKIERERERLVSRRGERVLEF